MRGLLRSVDKRIIERRGLLIPGEPAIGEPHFHFKYVLNTNPGDTNWHAIDLSAEVDVGANAGFFLVLAQDTGGASYGINLSNADGGDNYLVVRTAGTGTMYGAGLVPLDSSYQVWWRATNADMDVARIWLLGYCG